MAVRAVGVRKAYGDDVALADLNLEVEAGSFTVICGPPKCGKSVLFRLLVGLEQPDAGQLVLDGENITALPPGSRRLGYVPQSFALFPNISVRDNIAYPLTLAKEDAAEIDRQVDRAAGMLSIGHLLAKTPDQLSGGEKQRAALARGLLKQAKVFVLDDPLVGLDYKLRERLMDDLKDLRRELGATFIYATSDSIEALRLATALVVMDAGGSVLQAGDPLDTYARPASLRAMELVGFPRANLLAGQAENGTVQVGPLAFDVAADAHEKLTVGFRPEAVRLTEAGASAARAKVLLVEDLGSEVVVHIDAQGIDLTCAFAVGQMRTPDLGEEVGIAVDAGRAHFFDSSGARLAAG